MRAQWAFHVAQARCGPHACRGPGTVDTPQARADPNASTRRAGPRGPARQRTPQRSRGWCPRPPPGAHAAGGSAEALTTHHVPSATPRPPGGARRRTAWMPGCARLHATATVGNASRVLLLPRACPLPGERVTVHPAGDEDGLRGPRWFSGAAHSACGCCTRHAWGERPSRRVWCRPGGAPAWDITAAHVADDPRCWACTRRQKAKKPLRGYLCPLTTGGLISVRQLCQNLPSAMYLNGKLPFNAADIL